MLGFRKVNARVSHQNVWRLGRSSSDFQLLRKQAQCILFFSFFSYHLLTQVRAKFIQDA